MKNTFRKALTLLMVLCMLVPLFGFAALAADAEDLPIDYQFKDADVPNADGAQVLAAGMTNDPYSSNQWGMKMIGMEAAWQSGLTGRGVRVAVIDGGVYTNTGDFDADRLLPGKNMIWKVFAFTPSLKDLTKSSTLMSFEKSYVPVLIVVSLASSII